MGHRELHRTLHVTQHWDLRRTCGFDSENPAGLEAPEDAYRAGVLADDTATTVAGAGAASPTAALAAST